MDARGKINKEATDLSRKKQDKSNKLSFVMILWILLLLENIMI